MALSKPKLLIGIILVVVAVLFLALSSDVRRQGSNTLQQITSSISLVSSSSTSETTTTTSTPPPPPPVEIIVPATTSTEATTQEQKQQQQQEGVAPTTTLVETEEPTTPSPSTATPSSTVKKLKQSILSSACTSLCTPCLTHPSSQSSNSATTNTDLQDLLSLASSVSSSMNDDYNTKTADQLVADIIKENILAKQKQSTTNNNNDDESNIIIDYPCETSHANITSIINLHTRLTKLSIVDLLRFYRNVSVDQVFNNQHEPFHCILSLVHSENCNVETESFFDCIHRLGGAGQVKNILPYSCVEQPFWRDEVGKKQDVTKIDKSLPSNHWMTLNRGVIPESTVKKSLDERSTYIEPQNRNPSPFGPPLFCTKKNGNETKVFSKVHPMGYGVTSTTVIDKIRRTKAFDFMPLLPGSHAKLSRNYKVSIREEQIYRELYATSYFAFTNVRGGAETARHYEILASGSVPYFPEMPIVGNWSLTSLPKFWLKKVLELPGVNKEDAGLGPILKSRSELKKTIQEGNKSKVVDASEFLEQTGNFIHFKKAGKIVASKFNRETYFEIADALLTYTRKYLTCASVAASLLQRMGVQNAKKILIISRFEYNYLYETIHQGLSELGIQVTAVDRKVDYFMQRQDNQKMVFPLKNHTETDRGRHMGDLPWQYGHGLTYVAREFRPPVDHEYIDQRHSHNHNLSKRIMDGEFDAAIYTYVPTVTPFLKKAPYLKNLTDYFGRQSYDDLINKTQNSKIAFVDCDDAFVMGNEHFYGYAVRYGMVFSREIDRVRSCMNPNPPDHYY